MENTGQISNNAIKREDIALIRALARHAGEKRDFVEFAEKRCLNDDAMRASVDLLDEGKYKALTETGAAALSELEAAVRSVLDFRSPTIDSFARLERALNSVLIVLEKSEASLCDLFSNYPDVLSVEDCESLEKFLPNYIFALCRYVAVNYGPEELAPLRGFEFRGGEDSFNDICEIRNKINSSLRGKATCGAWAIERTEGGDGFLRHTKGYVLVPIGEPVEDFAKRKNLEKVAFNVYAGVHGNSSVAYSGYGNLIGLNFEESYKLREPDIHTSLPVDAFPPNMHVQKNPLAMIESFFNDNAFCVSPEGFALALDRFAKCHEFEHDGDRHELLCLCCGEPAGTRGFCRKHRG